jgi:hypothetical protein
VVVRQALALKSLLTEKFGARELLTEWLVSITLENGQNLHRHQLTVSHKSINVASDW